MLTDPFRSDRRLFRKAVQQGRSKRRGEAYSLQYVEPLSAVRTPLADFVNSLLGLFLKPGAFGVRPHALVDAFLPAPWYHHSSLQPRDGLAVVISLVSRTF
jgi:hypothetical protein